MAMPKINFGYAAAAILLFSSWLMMVIAISMPDWSNNTSNGGPGLVRAGLWDFCVKPSNGWQCISVPEPIKSNGYMVTCRVLTIFGVIITFLANMAVYGAMKLRKLGAVAVGLCVLSFILLSISWGMWIGVHSDYYDKDGLDLDLASSFIMCCVASAFTMLSICASIAGMVLAGKAEKHEKLREIKDHEYGLGEVPKDVVHAYSGDADGQTAPVNTPDVEYPQHEGQHAASPTAPYPPSTAAYTGAAGQHNAPQQFNGVYPQYDPSMQPVANYGSPQNAYGPMVYPNANGEWPVVYPAAQGHPGNVPFY